MIDDKIYHLPSEYCSKINDLVQETIKFDRIDKQSATTGMVMACMLYIVITEKTLKVDLWNKHIKQINILADDYIKNELQDKQDYTESGKGKFSKRV